MPTASIRDVTLYYEEHGSGGEALLWLHGSSGSHLGWAQVYPAFTSQYRCILYDHRDAGQSSASPRPYSIRDLADDAARLLDHLDVARAHVVGFSMGGAVAQELAINYPDRVLSLALIASYDAGDPRGADNLHSWALMRKTFTPEQFARATAPWVLTYREYLIPGFVDGWIRRALENPLRMSEAAYERQQEAVFGHDATDRLDRIMAPCLVVNGDDDILTPLRFAHTLTQRIPQARLEVIPEVGHGLLGVKPAAVADTLRRFFASLEQEPERVARSS